MLLSTHYNYLVKPGDIAKYTKIVICYVPITTTPNLFSTN
jgi:hypothetical protein